MTTFNELDDRVTQLEDFIHEGLTAKVEAMNWAIGQTYQSTRAIRVDIAGLHVGLGHLEAGEAANTAALKTALNLRTSELRHDLGEMEASIRHDLSSFRESVRKGFDAVHHRFEQVDGMFGEVDRRFEQVDRRFEQMDQRFDEVLSAIRDSKGARSDQGEK